ncbi:xanthine phosphoribosyltransferase [Mycoplasma sp. P36-A1]|uniref:xanthine phosphoribosyltransferase n=1 Tax=Mycoplasma sp. P36-A1 TaxID=3252900 RepID=UPI003C2D5814
MKELKRRISLEGIVIEPNILKVDSFINHQIDVKLYEEIGKEIAKRYEGVTVDRILTVEAGGIALACFVSQAMNYQPVVYAKKDPSAIISNNVYHTKVHSFTKNKDYNIRVDKRFIKENENILIIDDFLANGEAGLGLANIVESANAIVAGFGIVIEKGFQPGRSKLEEKGYKVESLAIIESFKDGKAIIK